MAGIPRLLLNNGQEMPVIGLGTYGHKESGDREKTTQAVKDAILAAGYRHIDTAWCYDNEESIGEAIREVLATGNVTREELFVTSKLWWFFLKRDKVVSACRDSLQKLGLDYLDLYLIHWPMALVDNGTGWFPKDAEGNFLFDNEVDVFVETWKGMEECVCAGLVKSIGLSNFNSQQIEKVLSGAEIKPAVLQIECHPRLAQRPLIDFCRERGIVLTAYSPLGGSPNPGTAEPTAVSGSLFGAPIIKELAAKYGKTAAQILLKFQVQRGLSVVPKSVTKERIVQNIDLFDFDLTAGELASLEAMDTGERHVNVANLAGAKNYPFSAAF